MSQRSSRSPSQVEGPDVPVDPATILGHLLKASIDQQRVTQQLVTNLGQLTRGWLQTQHAAATDARRTANQVLTKLTADNEIEAYLHTFEVVAGREGWPRADWAKVLAPFLSGEVSPYYALLTDEAEDYTCLKAAVLARAGLFPGAAVGYMSNVFMQCQNIKQLCTPSKIGTRL